MKTFQLNLRNQLLTALQRYAVTMRENLEDATPGGKAAADYTLWLANAEAAMAKLPTFDHENAWEGLRTSPYASSLSELVAIVAGEVEVEGTTIDAVPYFLAKLQAS